MCHNPGSLHATACVFPFASAGPGTNISGSSVCHGALCHAVAISYFFRPLEHYFKLGLFSSCQWWQLLILHWVRNVPWRRDLCMVLVGLVTGVPRFVARKPPVEDDTVVVCPPKIVFPVAMWRPSSRPLLLLWQKSGKFPWQV